MAPESKYVQLYVTVIAILLALSTLLWTRPEMAAARDWFFRSFWGWLYSLRWP
jgi:hypothetical protein